MRQKRNWFKIVLKITAVLFVIVIIVLSFFVYRFTKQKTDQSVIEKFKEELYQPVITKIKYKGHLVRVLSMQKELDTILPVIVFVHGSPGSAIDFKRYLADSDLNINANLISYDRVGYGLDVNEDVLNDLGKELEVLYRIIPVKDMKKVILIGYSYGGTIVAAARKNYKTKILLAPAIKGDLEPMFWLLNLYKWKSTRSIIPNVFKNAAQQKINHLTELPSYEDKWNISPSHVISMHGDKDRIVPLANSLFLQSKFDKDQFELITIPGGNHGLVWNQFDWIKSEILKEIKK
jgi:hypothetical protein